MYSIFQKSVGRGGASLNFGLPPRDWRHKTVQRLIGKNIFVSDE
jgi:hypothetical protein